jgi:hypothetical protein
MPRSFSATRGIVISTRPLPLHGVLRGKKEKVRDSTRIEKLRWCFSPVHYL